MEQKRSQSSADQMQSPIKKRRDPQFSGAQSPGGRFGNNMADEPPGNSTGSGGGGGVVRKMLVGLALAAVLLGFYFFFGSKTDDVDSKTQQQWEVGFLAARPLLVEAVEPSRVSAAISGMNLPASDRKNLQSDIDKGQARLVYVTLWDTQQEDKDTVEIESGNFKTKPIVLKKEKQRIAVPEPPSGVVRVTGVHDGGGGITVGMLSGTSPVNLPVMKKGQTLGVPVLVSR